MMPKAIYVLCAITSLFCFLLLFRGYLRSRTQVLLLSSASFFVFAFANALLVVDIVLLPNVDLLLLRNSVTLIGVALLLWGLITNS